MCCRTPADVAAAVLLLAAAVFAAALLLLLFYAVCHRVRHSQIWCWCIESDLIITFISLLTRIFLMAPWQCWRIYCLDLPSSSACMRTPRAKACVSPPRRSPLCKMAGFSGIHLLLLRPRIVSRALGFGASREPACTLRCKSGSRPGSVARYLGAQRRPFRQVTMGLLSDKLQPTRPMQTPKMS